MSKKIRLGYDILSKRAIETESGVNIDDALKKITAYKMASGTGADSHPDVARPSTKHLYVVHVASASGIDEYREWIWSQPENLPGSWVCIGGTSNDVDSWKRYSETNGSSGNAGSIWIGKSNDAGRDNTFILGDNNLAELTDDPTYAETDYTGTDVLLIGTGNTATNAANTYQIGKNNTVSGNNLDSEQYGLLSMAVNIGNTNTITKEGVNIGKDNTSTGFGISIGQHNQASDASISLGESVTTTAAAFAFGRNATAYGESVAIGCGGVSAGIASDGSHDGSSAAFGYGHLYAEGRSILVGTGATNKNTVVRGNSLGIISDSMSDNNTGSTITGRSVGIGYNLQVSESAFCIGANNSSITKQSYVFGYSNTNVTGQSIVFGHYNDRIGPISSSYSRAIALGFGNTEVNNSAIAIGTSNNKIANASIVLGTRVGNIDGTSVAIGMEIGTVSGNSIAIGNSLYQVQNSSVAFGVSSTAKFGSFVCGNGSSARSSSFVFGMGSSGEEGSIVMGDGSRGYRGAIMLGIGNSAKYSTGAQAETFHANSVIMGFGNQVFNVREQLKQKTTCGIAIGSYITAYGHNVICLGSRHLVGDATNWANDDVSAATDNDGFMTAIGYQCEALRNYDFAFGYQSAARGGENVAIQHSSATGFRNLSMFDSTVHGTGNIGIMESTLNATMYNDGEHPDTKYLVHNALLHANYTVQNAAIVQDNRVINAHVTSRVYSSMYNTFANITDANLSASYMADNILLGDVHFREQEEYDYDVDDYVTVQYGYDVDMYDFSRNLLYMSDRVNSQLGNENSSFSNNVGFFAKIDMPVPNSGVDEARYFNHNFIFKSSVSGNPKSISNNLLLCDSKLITKDNYVDTSTGTTTVDHNILFHTILVSTPDTAGGNWAIGHNLLFGTYATDVSGTVSFCDYSGDSADNSEQANLTKTCRLYNFGDSKADYVTDSIIEGSGNTVTSLRQSSIFGFRNSVTGDELSGRLKHAVGALFISGADNEVTKSRLNGYSNYLERTVILGSNNRIVGDYMTDNFIFGSKNAMLTPRPDEETDIETIRQYQKSKQEFPRFKVSVSGVVYSFDEETGEPAPPSVLWSGEYYRVDMLPGDDRYTISAASSSSSGTTSITSANFITKYNNKTLTEGVYYISSGYVDTYNALNVVPYGGMTITPNDSYHLNASGYVSSLPSDNTYLYPYPNSYNYDNAIFGVSNNIRHHVNGYFVAGMSNIVNNTTCPVGPKTEQGSNNYKTISHGIVQGNNNVALNGSNIVILGNGNEATGHNSVAIGMQLKSSRWQTVLGKYNSPIDGPDRLTSPDSPTEKSKALLILGNGYSTRDDSGWQDEQYITRSNAMVVYANGDATFSGSVTASNIPPAPSADGRYALNCIVSSGVPTYRWVPLGTVTV